MRTSAKRTILAALGVMVLLAACQPTPTATITATAPRNPYCWNPIEITGTVTPADATPRVVLQRTVGGKWVDWQWITYPADTTRTRLVAVPNPTTGAYRLTFMAPGEEGVTVHIRVRSDDGTSFSNAPYITTRKLDAEYC